MEILFLVWLGYGLIFGASGDVYVQIVVGMNPTVAQLQGPWLTPISDPQLPSLVKHFGQK